MWNETSAKYLLSTGKVDLFCKQELKFTLITVRSVKTWSNETWVSFQNFFFVKFSCQNIEEGLTLNNTMFNNLPILLKDQTYSQNFVTQSIALFKYHWNIAEDKSLLALIFTAQVMAYNATCERKFPFAFSAFHLHIRRIYQKIKREIS